MAAKSIRQDREFFEGGELWWGGGPQAILIVLSFVFISWLGQRVPINIKEFVQDLRRHAGLFGAAQCIAPNAAFRSYFLLVVI